MANVVRTRFAPSPTGHIHVGNFRTALFAFLFARHNGGVNVLRIEDTDQNRLVPGAVESLLSVMKEMGIEFDEGYHLKSDGSLETRGDLGPYVQSERLDLYKKHAEELIAKGSAYYCFCSSERLDELRKEQTALKKPAMYDRKCRNLSEEERAARMEEFTAAGKRPVVRQAIPPEGQTTVHDLIYGDIVFDNHVLDDQVILKSDGFPTYHLAVVVDDHFMEITHVIRGEDWINSTPKHVLLYQAFGWEPTAFAHVPNILNPDKTKLSKRQGDVTVEDFLAKGYLKEALVNFVAFLGWNPKTEQELFSLEDLIREFDLAKINRAGAVFDPNKLDWMNGLYVRATETPRLVEMVKPYLVNSGVEVDEFPDNYLTTIVELEKDRLKKLSDITEGTGYLFGKPEYEPSLLVWKKSTPEQSKQVLSELGELFSSLEDADFTAAKLEEVLKNFIADKGYDNGTVLWPLRVALTGLQRSPGPFEVAATLFIGFGKNELIDRINSATEKL